MRTRRLLGAAALSTALVAGLAGCVKMDMQLDLQSDDTVDGSILMAVSSALAEMSGQDPESLLGEMNADDMVDQGAVTSTEPYDDGEYIGQTIHFEGESLESFSGGGDEDLQIVREGDEYVVSGVMDLSDAAMGTEGEGGEMFSGLMESFDVRVSITFPGKVSEHNGELDGNTVTWTPRVGETNEISARGSAIEGGGGSGLPLPLLIGIGLAVLAAIGLILFFVLRSRKNAAAPAAAAYGAPAGYEAQPGYGAPAAYTPDAGHAPTAPTAPAPPETGYAAPPAPPAPPAPEQGQTPPPPA